VSAIRYYQRMDVCCSTPLGKGQVVLLGFYKNPNAYGVPIVPAKQQLAYRIDNDCFILFDSATELMECLAVEDIPSSIRCNAAGYADLMAGYYNLGRVLHGKNSVASEYAERVVELESHTPVVRGNVLVFLTIRFQEPYPRIYRNTLSLESLACNSEHLVDSDKVFHRLT
jgi:hypothetical protein